MTADPHRRAGGAGRRPLAAAPVEPVRPRGTATPSAPGSSSSSRCVAWELAAYVAAGQPGRPSDAELHGRRGGPLLRAQVRALLRLAVPGVCAVVVRAGTTQARRVTSAGFYAVWAAARRRGLGAVGFPWRGRSRTGRGVGRLAPGRVACARRGVQWRAGRFGDHRGTATRPRIRCWLLVA